MVTEQIADGKRFLDRLREEGFPVTVAGWLRESSNGRWVFFDMAQFAATWRKSFNDTEWQQAQEKTLYPVIPAWTGGFSFASGLEPDTVRCCRSRGRLELSNSSHRARKCRVTMTVQTWYPQAAHLVLKGLGIEETHVVSCQPRKVCLTCVVPTGRHAIMFDCDAAQAPADQDPRERVFMISRFAIEDIDQ